MRLACWSALAVVVLAAVTAFIYSGIARRFDLEALGRMPERSEVVDRNGIVLGRLHGENRSVVELAEVSPHFIEAILAREDNRFRRHPGIDFLGVVRAALRNLKDRRVVQGAST
ncbi:MAG TPA: transglycosylase domain-containing protein, partial [Longimicrobiaceae bacterium]|nr:transglycosylase domain-containing protein [Longimicrobiaceae bacterium]